MKKGLLLFLTVIACCCFFSACGSPLGNAEVYSPLDGTVMADENDHGDYLIVASIDNGPDSEPQSGVGQADLLIEIPAEGGINRFLAFFWHHTPDTIGPIRSARHYMYDIIKNYDAVLAHCGGSTQAYDVINSGTVKDIDEMGCGANFWRSEDRKAPHNLYTSYEKLAAKAAERGYDTVPYKKCPGFTFYDEAETAEMTFGDVLAVNLPYHFKPVRYEWSEDLSAYARYSRGNLSVDALDDSPVVADNVVVLYVDYTVMDNEGRLDMDITDGNGELLQNGNLTRITWQLSSDGFVFTDTETEEIVPLLPGKTVIQFIKPATPAEYEYSAEAENS